MGNGTTAGHMYEKTFNNLTKSYSAESFNSIVLNFKRGLESNATGIYNNYPLRRKNQIRSLLKIYYPK